MVAQHDIPGTTPSMTAAADDMPEKEQSMDDILASIRRIMLDEQARLQDGPGAPATPPGRTPAAGADPVLILDSSMVVEGVPPEDQLNASSDGTEVRVNEARHADAKPAAVTSSVPADAETGDAAAPVQREPSFAAHTTVLGATGVVPVDLASSSRPVMISAQEIEALMAPAAAAAATASVEALLKQLGEERLAALKPSAPSPPSLEEVVRSELRPFLKAWLDEHLPPMVERLVRTEITRLIGR
ncbi:DUF2497 domain-containing protein [Acidisoma sp.]|uniref:DUF2497 domain-containing protein n=1 Tax=Acidisoma sp. TaxID=1872115 RepID=UPI003B00F204